MGRGDRCNASHTGSKEFYVLRGIGVIKCVTPITLVM